MPRTPENNPLWGETLCLDFANSVDWSGDEHFRPDETDVLRSADELGRWGRRLGLLSERAAPAGVAELRRARELRDALHRLFSETAVQESLDLLMASYAEAVEAATLARRDAAYTLAWSPEDPRAVRFAAAADAVALLQDPARLERVSLCPGRDCGWLFLNTSGRRRWCSMSTCGSREKMRRLHRRRTAGGPA